MKEKSEIRQKPKSGIGYRPFKYNLSAALNITIQKINDKIEFSAAAKKLFVSIIMKFCFEFQGYCNMS